MKKETHYGIISDIHEDPRIVQPAIEVLKSLGIEKLIVNGDIGNQQRTLQDSQNYVTFILNSIANSGLEAHIQPGSHESLLAFGPVIEHFSEKYSNIIDATKQRKVEQGDHDLVFLPGSDFLCGGEYQIGKHDQLESGRYFQTEDGLVKFKDFEQYVSAIQQGISRGAVQFSNMNDLRSLVTDPDKTIVVCHVPRRFDDPDVCVDMAQFGEVTRTYEMQGELIEKGSVYPLATARKVREEGHPVEIKRENRGNNDLRALYDELGIKKAISAHFHESSHRATDSNGRPVNEGELVYDLFWNSGHLDNGKTGILTVDDGRVSYRNIDLLDYLR